MDRRKKIVGYGFSNQEIQVITEIAKGAQLDGEFFPFDAFHARSNSLDQKEICAILLRHKPAVGQVAHFESFLAAGKPVPILLLADRVDELFANQSLEAGFTRALSVKNIAKTLPPFLTHLFNLASAEPGDGQTGAAEKPVSWYKQLVESTDNIVFVFDSSLTFSYLNPHGGQVLGLDTNKVQGQPMIWEDIIRFDPNFYFAVQQVIKQRAKTNFLSKVDLASTTHWFDVSLIPLKVSANGTLDIMGLARDITGFKNVELSLKQKQDMYLRLMDVSPVVIYSTTPIYPYQVGYISENVKTITGYEPTDFTSQAGFWISKVHPDDRYKVLTGLENLETSNHISLEYRIKFKDGQYHILFEEIRVVYDEKGLPVEGIGFFLEITEQRKIAEEIRRSEKRYRSLAEASHDLIFMISADFKLEYLNSYARIALGVTEAESYYLQSEKINQLIHADLVRQVIRSGNPLYAEYKIETLEKPLWLGTWLVPVQDKTLSINSIMGVGRDITNRRKIEENLQRALSAEREVNNLRYRLMTMSTHEFKTPLSTIVSSAELLEHYGEHWSREKQVEHYQRILKAANRVVAMLDQILEVNRMEYSGQISLSSEFNLLDLCNEIMLDIRNSDGGKHNIILVQRGEKQLVNLDIKQVRSILENLLSNAIKYSSPGSEVILDVETEDKEVRFRIRDRGIGISEADRTDLFEPFFRSKEVAQIPGTGLGLTVVKKSVELLKGTIDYVSREGGGTDFVVALPIPPKK